MRSPAVLAALAAVVLLSGCVQSVAVRTERGIPDGYGGIDLLDPQPLAMWLGDGERFAVVTFGSSSCPPVPTSVEAVDDATIAIAFTRSPTLTCTADLGPTTHEFETPDGIPAGGQATVRVTREQNEYSLPLG